MKRKIVSKVIKKRVQDYLNRRPHRSFRLTRRRDCSRSLELPNFWVFTMSVNRLLWKHKKLFLSLAVFYAIMTVLLCGIASQDTYMALSNTMSSTSGDAFGGFFGKIGGASLLLASMMTGGLSSNLSDVQQVYAMLMAVLTWLTCVWLLRNVMAGRSVKLRDGVYNAGAPIVPTFLITLVLLVQLLPFAIAMIGFSSASMAGLLDNGVESMLFWIAIGLLILLSIYFITGTIFALVIATIPGMYPMKAISLSGDMVIGRRMRILLRLIWMLIVQIIFWIIFMVPTILMYNWLSSFWSVLEIIPVVPSVLLMLSSITIVWCCSYVYLLYRKVVEDEAEPA